MISLILGPGEMKLGSQLLLLPVKVISATLGLLVFSIIPLVQALILLTDLLFIEGIGWIPNPAELFGEWGERLSILFKCIHLQFGRLFNFYYSLELNYNYFSKRVFQFWFIFFLDLFIFFKYIGPSPVSYTHLDVYKRQIHYIM